MDSKKLKLLAKLATSALAINAFGVGVNVSAMEHDKSSAEVLLKRALIKLNDTKRSYSSNLSSKMAFLGVLESCRREYYNDCYHEDFYRDLYYSFSPRNKPDGGVNFNKFETTFFVPEEDWDVVYEKVKEYFIYLTQHFSHGQFAEDGPIAALTFESVDKLVNEFVNPVLPLDKFGNLTTEKEHFLEFIEYYFFSKKDYQNTCPVCLEDCKPTQTKIMLRCGHSFHESCYNYYVPNINVTTTMVQCPVCKKMNSKYSDIKKIEAKSNEFDENAIKKRARLDYVKSNGKKRYKSVKKFTNKK